MAELTRMDLKRIAQRRGFPVVSIHTPTEKVGEPLQRNSVMVKNAVTRAMEQLRAQGMKEKVAEALLQPALDLSHDRDRMLHQLGAMSIFLNEDGYDIVELPARHDLQVEVGERPYLLPLVKPTFLNTDFAVLTLSLGGAGLYRCSRYSAEMVNLPDLPEDLAYVLRYDDFEKSIQPHMTDSGGRKAGMHGHGLGKDDQDSFVSRFVKAVENEVSSWMQQNPMPLVLLGADEVIGRYRDASSYKNIADRQIATDPFSVSIDDIISEGWKSVEPGVTAARVAAIERFGNAESTSEELYTVLPALTEGRVATLFVNPDADLRGSYDSARGEVHRASGSEDTTENIAMENLVNRAVLEALATGTEIVVVEDEIPAPSVILH